MAIVEHRILGDHPAAKAGAKFDSTRAVFAHENPDHERIEDLPTVLFQDKSVRYEPFTGTLHLSSFRTKPDSPGVTYKRWASHTSLESVTGAAVEILTNYADGGDVVNRTLELYEFVNERLGQFGDNAVTDSQLTDLHQEAAEKLDQLGFSTAHKPSKTEISKQVSAGVNFDSKNRRNPLISRARLASSVMKLLVERRFENEVADKYLRLFFLLLAEQKLEEAYVKEILSELFKENFTPDILKVAFKKQIVKASPYRLPVMQAYITQFGGTDFETRMYFENDDVLREALNDSGIPLDERRGIIIRNLETALENGESIYSV